MKHPLRIVAVILLTTIAGVWWFYGSGFISASRQREAAANEVAKLAIQESSITLYTLDPQSRHGYETHTETIFHGVGILGKATINQKDGLALISALAAAARNKTTSPDLCFNPGFGLSVREGDGTKDLLICFDCGQMRPFGFNSDMGIPITDQPLTMFIEAAKHANLPR